MLDMVSLIMSFFSFPNSDDQKKAKPEDPKQLMIKDEKARSLKFWIAYARRHTPDLLNENQISFLLKKKKSWISNFKREEETRLLFLVKHRIRTPLKDRGQQRLETKNLKTSLFVLLVTTTQGATKKEKERERDGKEVVYYYKWNCPWLVLQIVNTFVNFIYNRSMKIASAQ